jgi:hypothetical protein
MSQGRESPSEQEDGKGKEIALSVLQAWSLSNQDTAESPQWLPPSWVPKRLEKKFQVEERQNWCAKEDLVISL